METHKTPPPLNPLVSVIVPSFNKEDFIGATIDSVLAQSGVEVEVIVVDDGSTDGTLDLLDTYGETIRLHRLENNSGAARARNLGAELARGTHFMFLDADDVLNHPDTLVAMTEALEGQTDRFAASPWQRLRREGQQWVVYSPDKPLEPPGGDPVSAWLGTWYIPPCAILWPRRLFEVSGGWDESLPVAQDEELMIRMLLRDTPIVHANRGESRYRFLKNGGSLSTTMTRILASGRISALQKLEQEATSRGKLPEYAHAMGKKHFGLSRSHLVPYPDLVLEALACADRLMDRHRVEGSVLHRLAIRLLGFERKERITRWLSHRGWVDREQRGVAPEGP